MSELLKCPFCEARCVVAEPGNTRCPDCGATFELDDRADCLSGNIENLRLPALGTICASCGLIQASDHQHCLYCGSEISLTVH